jgi:hypothetical protein
LRLRNRSFEVGGMRPVEIQKPLTSNLNLSLFSRLHTAFASPMNQHHGTNVSSPETVLGKIGI